MSRIVRDLHAFERARAEIGLRGGHEAEVAVDRAAAELDVVAARYVVWVGSRPAPVALPATSGGSADRHTTVPEHMPSSHRRYADWTVERIRREAASIRPATAAFCELIVVGHAVEMTFELDVVFDTNPWAFSPRA
jgi:hypothetical protein